MAIPGGQHMSETSQEYRDWARLIQHRHRVEPETFWRIWDNQGGACAICEGGVVFEHGPAQACVDLHPATHELRGILCAACKSGLGTFTGNPDTMRRAADYIESHESGEPSSGATHDSTDEAAGRAHV